MRLIVQKWKAYLLLALLILGSGAVACGNADTSSDGGNENTLTLKGAGS